ncbi:hypothetical protein QBC38DRAFT_356783 [Podospora fimiseda]|uniref:GCN5-related N-acetyltransferase Rv2170-like domain-containing protein n=1 Tax=Podospora fimiseda TaxID=252190 RepID=A0AAN7H467_9PEZI|nr:hypothetical protein QBC38DRAFT_356783 [Podospora fimiseda]
MASEIIISDITFPTPSSSSVQPLLSLLDSHLPFSLPVLRRIQFALQFPGGYSRHTHILHCYYPDDSVSSKHFVAAYVDLSRGPETQVWIYSSIEDSSSTLDLSNVQTGVDETELKACDELLGALLKRIRRITGENETEVKKWILFGSVNEVTRQGMFRCGVQMNKTGSVPQDLEWEFCGKWVFRIEELEDIIKGVLGKREGMKWDVLKEGDVPVVQSRTGIFRSRETLMKISSVVVRLVEGGRPVAWGFLGYDGTLISLHVEEEYRRMGLAKAVACKVMKENLSKYGDDGWGAADVFVENEKSQALCKSIGGVMRWTLSW